MHERVIPASPNWYCGRCSDTNQRGVMGFGARNTVYLLDVSAESCSVLGDLSGHKERVSGFSFCRQAGQDQLCASSSDDGTVKFWDADDRVLLKEHSGHQGTIVALHWSPADKNLVVSGDDKGVVVCYWFNTGDCSSFFPLPKALFSLSCSPHSWKLLALGYKQGIILLVDVSKKGEVLHRLRGHEDEIHSLSWSPSTPALEQGDAPQDPPGEEEGSGGYLASGSRDQTIRVWSTDTGRGITTLKLPYLKKRGGGVGGGGGAGGGKDRLWLSVHWPDDRPSQLLSSCFSGELVLWDLGASGKQKWSVLGSGDQNHSRIVFNMSSVRLASGRQLLLTTSMDREIKCWDLASLECVWTLPTLGGSVYALSFSPVATGLLALGGADQMIRSWDTLSLQNPYLTKTFWQGIRSKITALVWHPSREGSLAFGTDDGKVGIYDAFSNKPPQISSSYHHKTIYRLAWGPPLPPLSFGGAGERPSCSLYSCGGEGAILQHDPRSLASDACNIDKLIRDTNGIKHKLSPHSDFSWKPDGTVVAVGNEDGSVDVYAAPALKQLCSVQQHNKIINTLQWYHPLAPQPELQYLLASGSSSAKVYVHDLRSACEAPADPPAVISEAFRTLGAHTGKITGLSWSPHHPARLATVSYDHTAQVWDVLKGEGLVNYRGHGNRVMCVEWSPVDPDVVWTGADDFTVHEWKPSKQEFTAPPKGEEQDYSKKPVGLREKNKQKKINMAAGGQREGESPPVGEREASERGTRSVDGERETKAVNGETETKVVTGERGWRERDPKRVNGERETVSVNRERETKARKKARSMLPLSTAMDHRSKEDLLEDCVTLATITHSPGCVPGKGPHLQLGLFSDRPALHSMFQEEEEAHLAAGHPDSVVYLRLWSGDVEGALRTATERGELNDHLLAIAPTGGYRVWVRTVQDYVKQLCLQDQHLKAASFLLSINKLHEAIELLHSHKMYREAIALARARLPDQDVVLKGLYVSWAAALEKDGHLSAAAKCYVAAGAGFDAAKVVSKKSDAPSLRAAATIARLAGESQLAHTIALRCAKGLAASLDWVGAQQVLKAQEVSSSKGVHRLCFCVAEILSAALTECEAVSSHPWARPGPPRGGSGPEPPQDRVRAVWQQEFGVAGGSGVTSLLKDLASVEKSQLSSSSPAHQVCLLHVCLSTTCLSVYYMSVCLLHVCLSATCLSVYSMSVCLSTPCLSVYSMSVCLSTPCLSVCLSTPCLSVCLLHVCLSVYYMSVCLLHVGLSTTCLSVY
uniref:Gem nuclear organelle associated protein 5 n=1 Tax=Gadus morhua TaxID=8049 RepID=A0A8C4ZRC9_GADMO